MKRFLFVVSLFFVLHINSGLCQSAGFANTFIVLNTGGNDAYFDLFNNTGNADFNGRDFGQFPIGSSSFVLKGAEHKIYKCGGCNLESTRLYYRLYPSGAGTGNFTPINLSYRWELVAGCTDQGWDNVTNAVNLLQGLPAGNYTIEVYSEASVTCQGGTIYASNNGANYKATFTVVNDEQTADFKTRASGSFSSAEIWQYNAGGSLGFVNATQAPSANNNISILGGHAITLDMAPTINAGKSISVSGTLNTGDYRIYGAGSVLVNNGGIIGLESPDNGGAIESTVLTTGGFVLAPRSTVELRGTTAQFLSSRTFSNLVVSNTAGVQLRGDVVVDGTLSLTTGTLALNGNTLSLNGAVSGTGTLAGSATSNLTIGGTAGTLNFQPGTGLLKNFVLSNGASATLGNALALTAGTTPGSVKVNSGATLYTGGFLTLKSDAEGTAFVDQSSGSISGNVTVERHIPALSSRRYRLLTAPVTGVTINQSWQENKKWNGITAETGTGYGTLITGQQQGTSGIANGNGFDFWHDIANSSASVRYYAQGSTNTAASWQPVGKTDAGPAFNSHEAYLLYVRGDRSISTGSNALATTLRATGALKMGNISITVPEGKSHTLVGNPYAAPLDFKSLYDDVDNNAGSPKIKEYFWAWQAGYGSNTGGYVLVQPVTKGSSTYEYLPSPFESPGAQSTANRIIHSGQGFFVVPNSYNPANTSTTAITIKESHKSATEPGVAVFRQAGLQPAKLYVNLNAVNSGTKQLLDGVLARFDATYTGTGNDVAKAVNAQENLSIPLSGSDLIVSSGLGPKAGDVLPLRMWNTTEGSYQLELKTVNFASLGLTAVLRDSYLATQTPVSLQDAITVVDFTVTADAASKDPNRFSILFRSGAALPLSLTALKASEKNGAVAVEWTVESESGVKSYEVERSADGRHFRKLDATAPRTAAGAQTYQVLDALPLPVNYYRVKLVGTSGEVRFSAVAKLALRESAEAIRLYPNPATNGHLQLEMVNQPAGLYVVRVYNAAGQLVLQKSLQHAGGTGTQTLAFGETFTSGTYKVELKAPAGKKATMNLAVAK